MTFSHIKTLNFSNGYHPGSLFLFVSIGCFERNKGLQVFVSETELGNTANATPVFTSPSSVTQPEPIVKIEPIVLGR